jgi:hypothetical protein
MNRTKREREEERCHQWTVAAEEERGRTEGRLYISRSCVGEEVGQ